MVEEKYPPSQLQLRKAAVSTFESFLAEGDALTKAGKETLQKLGLPKKELGEYEARWASYREEAINRLAKAKKEVEQLE